MRCKEAFFIVIGLIYSQTIDADNPYLKLERTYCAKADAPYETLALAKKACDEDFKCDGVYDKSCDDQDGYYLCPKVDKSLSSGSGSCVYEKIVYQAYTDGPSVKNSGYRACSDEYGNLVWAQQKCNEDANCSWLHDTYCDDRLWRFCTNVKIDGYKETGADSCSKLKGGECKDNVDWCDESFEDCDDFVKVGCPKSCKVCKG